VNLYTFTQGWYLLELSGQKLSVGLSWTLFFLPSLIIFPLIGRILDSENLKKTLIGLELVKCALLGVLCLLLTWHPSTHLIFGINILLGIAYAPFFPGIYVVLKSVLSQNQLTRYSHLFEVSLQVSNIVSVMASGLIYKAVGFEIILLIGSGLILISCFFLHQIQFKTQSITNKEGKFFSEYKNVIRSSYEAIRSAALTPQQLVVGLFHQFPQTVALISNVPILLYVYQVMKKGPVEYGILDSIFGIAAVAASLFWSHFHVLSEKRQTLFWVTLFSAISILIMGFTSPNLNFPYIVMFFYGAFLISSKILMRASVVRMTPQNKAGTFATLFQSANSLIMIFMFLITSYLSEIWNPPSVFLFLATLMFIYSGATWKLGQETSPEIKGISTITSIFNYLFYYRIKKP
jgi:MFS family permease